jgi:hypothetical protein
LGRIKPDGWPFGRIKPETSSLPAEDDLLRRFIKQTCTELGLRPNQNSRDNHAALQQIVTWAINHYKKDAKAMSILRDLFEGMAGRPLRVAEMREIQPLIQMNLESDFFANGDYTPSHSVFTQEYIHAMATQLEREAAYFFAIKGTMPTIVDFGAGCGTFARLINGHWRAKSLRALKIIAIDKIPTGGDAVIKANARDVLPYTDIALTHWPEPDLMHEISISRRNPGRPMALYIINPAWNTIDGIADDDLVYPDIGKHLLHATLFPGASRAQLQPITVKRRVMK